MGGYNYRDRLSEDEQEIWDRTVPHLEMSKEVYGESMYMYCKELAKYERCEEKLSDFGLTQVSEKTGYEQQRPEVSIGAAALKNAMAIAHKFGFDPYGTKKIIGIEGKNKNANKKPTGRSVPMRKAK